MIQVFQDGVDRLGLLKGLTFGGLDRERRGNNLLVERGERVLAVLHGAGGARCWRCMVLAVQGVKPAQISGLDFSKL